MAKIQLIVELNPELNKAEMAKAANAVKTALGESAKGINFADSANGASLAANAVGKISEQTQKASGFASGLGKAFQFNQIVQSAQAVSGALNEVIAVSNQFESSLAAVGAITGLSGDALGEIGTKARELAMTFGGSASDQLQSFQGILSKFGPQVAESSDALALFGKNISTLSAASGDSAAVSMSAVADSMLQFSLVTGDANADAETSTRVINALAASAEVGAAEIPQVAEAILQAGVAAKGAKMSFEETNAAIQVLAVGGKVGSEAGVALRNVLGLIQNASGPAAAAMGKLGTSSAELGKLLTEQGLDAALVKIKSGMDGVGSASEKNALLMQIFGNENSAAAGILLDNTDKYAQFVEGIKAGQEGTGAAFEQAAIRMDTADGIVSRLKATMGDMFISFGSSIGSTASAMLTFGNSVAPTAIALSGLSQMIPTAQIKELALTMLSKLVPSLVVSDVATKSLVLNKSALSLANIREAATNAVSIAGKYAAAAATWALTGATSALTAVMNLNPIGIILLSVVAAAAAIYVLYQNFESVRNVVDAVFSALAKVGDFVGNVFSGISDMVGSLFGDTGQTAGEAFSQGFAASDVKNKIEDTAKSLESKLGAGIKVKMTLDEAQSLPDILKQYENLQSKIAALKTKSATTGLSDAEKSEFKALEAAAQKTAETIQKIAPETKGTMRTIIDETGKLKIVYDVNIAKAKEFAQSGMASQNMKTAAKEYSADLIKQAGNLDELIQKHKENEIASNKVNDVTAKQKLVDKLNEEKLLIEATRKALVEKFTQGANAALVNDEALNKIAKTMGVTSDEARKMLVAKALENAAKSGKVTEAQVEKIARQFNFSKEKATELLREQQKNTAEAEATANAAKDIADSYNEVKKNLQSQRDYNVGQVLAYKQMIKDGKTLTAEQQKDFEQKQKFAAADTKQLKQRNQLEAEVNETYSTSAETKKTEKKESEDAYEIAKRKYDLDNQTAESAKIAAETAQREAQISSGRLETSIEKRNRELEAMRAENVEWNRQKLATAGLAVSIDKIYDKDKKAKALADLAKIQADLDAKISKNTLGQKELTFSAKLDDAKLKQEIDKINSDSAKNKLEFEVSIGTANASQLIEFEIAELQKKIDSSTKSLNAEISLGAVADTKAIAEYQAAIESANIAIAGKQRELGNQTEKERILAIQDSEQKALQLRLLSAKETYAQDYAMSGTNERAKIEALMKYQTEKLNAEQDYLRKKSGIYSVLDNVSEGFKSVNLSGTKKNVDEEIKAVEAGRKELEESLRKREISTADYIAKDRDLNEKAEAIKREQQNATAVNWSAAAKVVGDAMQMQVDAQIKAFELRSQTLKALEARDLELSTEIEKAKTDMLAAELSGRADLYAEAQAKMQTAETAKTDNDKKMADASSSVWTDSLGMIGTQFGALVLQGDNAGKALAKSLFQSVKAMVPTFVVMILGKSIQSLGPILGPITSGVLTAALYGLLSAAQSAAGFKKGGYTGDGDANAVAGVVHRGEHVFDAVTTSKNRQAFEEISKRKTTVGQWYESTHGDKIRQLAENQAESIAMQAMIAMNVRERIGSNDLSRLENELKTANEKLDMLTKQVEKGDYSRKTNVKYQLELELDKDKMIEAAQLKSYKNLARM